MKLETIVGEGIPCTKCEFYGKECSLQCSDICSNIRKKKMRGIRNEAWAISPEEKNMNDQLRYSEQGRNLASFESNRMPGKY